MFSQHQEHSLSMQAYLVCSDIKKPASSIIRACGKSLAIGEELCVQRNKVKTYIGLHVIPNTYRDGIDVTFVASKGLSASGTADIPKLRKNNKSYWCALNRIMVPWPLNHRHQKQKNWGQVPVRGSLHHPCVRWRPKTAGQSQCPKEHYTYTHTHTHKALTSHVQLSSQTTHMQQTRTGAHTNIKTSTMPTSLFPQMDHITSTRTEQHNHRKEHYHYQKRTLPSKE